MLALLESEPDYFPIFSLGCSSEVLLNVQIITENYPGTAYSNHFLFSFAHLLSMVQDAPNSAV